MMRAISLSLMVGLLACGGGDDTPPDAAIDAPTALMGLGELCNPMAVACSTPAETPACLGSGTTGFCTNLCADTASFMTDAMANPVVTSFMPDPSTLDAQCAAIYHGTVGTGICGFPYNRMPTGALQPNTTYSLQWICAIQCGANNTCPTGLTCNAQVQLCLLL
jgi:hypothetical protein